MLQPVVISNGLSGYLTLKATQSTQLELLSSTGFGARQEAYFREKMPTITSATELAQDYTTRNFLLTAFGLEEDISNVYFIERVLSEPVTESSSLANQLADKRYFGMAEAVQNGAFSISQTGRNTFLSETVERYHTSRFQSAVGDQNQTYRLALNAESGLKDIADSASSELSKWFQIMGDPPLRSVVDTALGLPSELSQIDLDDQVTFLRDAFQRRYGSSDISSLSDPDQLDRLVRDFVIRDSIGTTSSFSSGSIALALLS